jgi:hypothetical protein
MTLGGRQLAAVSAALFGAAACVDLFHATDFTTLCDLDAAACRPGDGAAPPTSDAGDAEAAAPDFCAWSPAEAELHAERACAWLGACEGARAEAAYGPCMLRAKAAYDCKVNATLRPRGATEALWQCLADVRSCAAVSTCLFGARAPTCLAAPSGAFTACSSGAPSAAVVQCALQDAVNPPVAIEPCVLEGRTCAVVDPSSAVCAGSAGTSCSGATRCVGTQLVRCKGLNDVGLDCAAFGAGRCVATDGGAACVPGADAPECNGPSEVHCDGAIARACVDGHSLSIDCGALGLRCDDSGAPSEPMAACTGAESCTKPDSCAGDIVRSCAQGKAFEIACSSLGLGPCKLAAAGLDPVATCRRP